jgi:hypothetical protein
MTPTTKLEAVNIMLSTIGESPVNSLSSGLVDAELAETILDATSRAVQSETWHFNRESKVRFAPNLSGEIILPTNILKADANLDADSINRQTSTGLPLDLVQRGTKMYDKYNHTFNIGKSVELDIVVGLDFDELPEVAKRYITIKAGRTFQDRVVGSSTLHGFQEADEARAYYELKETEGDTSDFNILNNYDVFAVIDRVSGKRIY